MARSPRSSRCVGPAPVSISIVLLLLWRVSTGGGAGGALGAAARGAAPSVPPQMLSAMRRLQVEECASAGATLESAALAVAPTDASAAGRAGGAGALCAAQLAPGAQPLRALEARLRTREAPALRVDVVGNDASGGGGGGGGSGASRSGSARCRQLRLFLRVAPVSASWSGAGRVLRWRKEQVVLAALQGLREALPPLAAVGVARVNVTVLFDGLSAHPPALLEAWRELIAEALLGGAAADGGAASILSLRFLAIASAKFSGNRGTNLVQFGLAREDPCFAAADAGLGDAASRELRASAAEAAEAAAAVTVLEGSGSAEGGWITAGAASVSSAAAAAGSGAVCGADDGAETLFYFVEDDYVHLPSALAELAQSLLLPWLDGSLPPDFVTLMDPPERLTRGREEADYGAATVLGGALRAWRTVQSSTMSFAGTCRSVRAALPLMERDAPYDLGIWLALRRRGLRLVGPTPALSLHAVAAPELSWYSPAELGWCGIVWCMREALRAGPSALDAGILRRANASAG
jgi:hypothetical protein